ncbi:hypothetical protein CTI12_AA116720 [Artemisia annua]|uniref:Leucine-rich repeat domain, L domain-like protein n=1 Tax=Artemisia annua TaxID=35608 RepID=A0A2U1PRC6_ARTAN|nr:hypothetical protein CTI12_AA116720 [Artemisia annua]
MSMSEVTNIKVDKRGEYSGVEMIRRFHEEDDREVLVLKSNKSHGHIQPSSDVEFPFPNLQVLELSYNGFVGQLPTKYFQNFNSMKRRIPDGRQFNTFDENSFEGNVGLCGFPLPKKCNEYTHKPQLESHEGHEEESGFTWEVLTLGYIWMWDPTWIKVKWFNAIQ